MKRFISACVVLFVVNASAQNLETVWLDPGGRGSMFVGNGQTLGHLDVRGGVSLVDSYGALRSQNSSIAVRDRFGMQAFVALGLFRWLEVGANVPVVFLQTGATTSGGLGNPWLHVKANILDASKPVTLGVDLGAGLPVGSTAALTNGGFEFAPKVQLGKVSSNFQVAGEVGFLYRPVMNLTSLTGSSDDAVGSLVWVAATATSINTSGPRGEVSLRATIPLTGGRVGVEGQLGARWPIGPVELFASAGPGFFGEPTTPLLRVWAGIALANTPMTQPPCREGEEYDLAQCPNLDKDQDGVRNADDQVPLAAEDRDGFEDGDGVPDPDNDHDGVADEQDGCPNVKGVIENKGCPDVDSDKDGIVDRLDRCAQQAEDRDGFEDTDGCPDGDNDGDGIADTDDRCPNEKGVAAERGCPVVDSDGDGVADRLDNCPQDKGTPENGGCPAAQKQLVLLTGNKLKILDKVYFDGGRATIQKRSFGLLANVARVLSTHTEINLVQVEGHTDDSGRADANKKLSQERADAVVKYLTEQGIAAARLQAIGFGSERPAEPNTTPAGREANRRVEFNLVNP